MIRYAGVETLLPSPEVEAFVNANLAPELAQYCCPASGGAEIDATAPYAPRDNWQKLFSPKLNCLYWPTGASRWATMLLLVDSSMLDVIVPLTSDSFSTNYSAEPAQLVIADSAFVGTINNDDWSASTAMDSVAMSTAMYALRPHPISSYTSGGSKTLWVLPLVDERYFWQWKNVGVMTDETPDTWAALIDHFETRLGVTITEGDIEDIYATIFSLSNYQYANAAGMLDAILRRIGHRFSRRITGECRTYAPTAATTVFEANTTDPDGPTHKGIWKELAGGEFTYNGAASMPQYVKVIGGTAPGKIQTIAISTVGGDQWRADTEVTIWTTYPDDADYPVGTDEVDYATQVATDWVAWRSKRIDRAFIGVKSWTPTGFEDYFAISHGALHQSPSTRVVTRPENSGIEPFPSSSSNPVAWGVVTDGSVAGAVAEVLIERCTDAKYVGETVKVSDYLGQILADESTAARLDRLVVIGRSSAGMTDEPQWVLINANCPEVV
jgi:hypothetical protein